MLPAITTHVVRVNGQARIVGRFLEAVGGACGAPCLWQGCLRRCCFWRLAVCCCVVLSAAQFRVVSPVVQTLSVMALVLLLLQYVQYGRCDEVDAVGAIGLDAVGADALVSGGV